MAKLKLYNSIEDKDTKTIMEGWFGIESTCYEDIKDFIENIPADDDVIDIYLHCPGGNCIEGWAMYDALRRLAQKNATILIHNPYCTDYFQYEEYAHADELDAMANKVRIQAEEMREMQEKIVNLYVERTGSSKEELQSLMNEDRCIGTDKALELGLIGDVLEPNTDKYHSLINKMEKGTVTVKATVLDRMLAKLGLKSIEEVAVNQVITDVTGAEITVDTDTEPAVGDAASPDGEFTLEDGSVMTIKEGVITSIDKKSEEEEDDDDDNEDNEDNEEKEKDEMIDSLQSQVDNLTASNQSLTTENETLKASNKDIYSEVETLRKSNKELSDEVASLKSQAKTEDEIALLDKINALGGMEWLEMAEKASSSARIDNNQFNEHKHDDHEDNVSIGAGYLAEKRAKRIR